MPSIYISDKRAREKPCLRCGLSLRKLFDVTHCPQCGLSIWLSLSDNDSMEWSNPAWLFRLSNLAWLLAGMQLIGFAAFAIAMLPLGNPAFFDTVAALLGGVYLIGYHAALLLSTRHEQRYPDRIKIRRIALQIVSGIGILGGIGLLTAATSGKYAHAPPPSPHRVMAATAPDDDEGDPEMAAEEYGSHFMSGLALRGLFLISSIATWAYFQRLARRLHNPTVRKICSILLFGPLLGLLKYSPFIGLYMLSMFSWVVDYLPWIYLPMTIFAFVRLAKDFRHASYSAAESWGKETMIAIQQPTSAKPA